MNRSKIRKLFDKREAAKEKYTQQIIDMLTPNVISAIIEVLGFSDEEIPKLNWHNVKWQGPDDDSYIVLIGAIMYEAGDQIVNDTGETLVLDTNTALVLNKFVRVTIPAELAESSSKDEIVGHLRQIEARYKKEYEEAYASDPFPGPHRELDIADFPGNSLEERIENALLSVMGEDGVPADITQGFDYTQLTDSQKEELRLSRLSPQSNTKGKIN